MFFRFCLVPEKTEENGEKCLNIVFRVVLVSEKWKSLLDWAVDCRFLCYVLLSRVSTWEFLFVFVSRGFWATERRFNEIVRFWTDLWVMTLLLSWFCWDLALHVFEFLYICWKFFTGADFVDRRCSNLSDYARILMELMIRISDSSVFFPSFLKSFFTGFVISLYVNVVDLVNELTNCYL